MHESPMADSPSHNPYAAGHRTRLRHLRHARSPPKDRVQPPVAHVPAPALATTLPDASTRQEATPAGLAVTAGGLGVAAVLPLVPWLLAMDGYHVVLAVAHALVCAFGAAVAVHQRFRPCLLTASVFPYCWLVVPSVYQIAHTQAAWGDPGVTVDFSATLRAQGILLLAQACLLTAYLVFVARRREAPEAWVVSAEGRSRLLVLAALFALGTLLLVPFVASQAGGFAALFTSRSEFNATLQSQGLSATDNATRALIKSVPSSFATSAIVLSLWLVRTSPRGHPMRVRAGAVALFTTLLLFVVANPFVYSRYIVLAAFGTVAMTYFWPRGRTAALAWLLGLLMAFLLVYPAADLFRSESRSSTGPMLASKDFDGFQQTINTVTYVDAHGTDHAIHLVSGLLFFVPRSIWTAKAIPSAFPVAQDRGYRFQNLSEPAPAEAYLDLGWGGVAGVMALLGLGFAALDRAWQARSRASVIAAYLAIAQVGLWRGPFGSLAPVFGFTIALLLLAVVLSRVGARAAPPTVPTPQ